MVNFNDPMYGFAPRMSVPSYSTAPPPAAFAPSVAPMPQQQPRGLLGMLGLGNTGLGGFVDSRRARLAAFGAGLASGRTLGEGLALGAQGAAGARQIDIENATNQQKLSKTREWFQKMSASDPFYADLMQAIDAGMPMQDAWAAAMKHQTGGGGEAPKVVEFFDEKTGLPYKAQWNPQTGQYDRVGGVKAPSGTSLSVGANGEVTFTQGVGAQKPLTEAQSKDVVFATRAEGALPILNEYEKSLTNLGESVMGATPVVGQFAKSKEYQLAEQAGKEFVQAILRKDTGAAITKEETEEYGSVYLPRPGDTPELILQKKEARSRAVRALRAGLPPQAILALEKAGIDPSQVAGDKGAGLPDGVTEADVQFTMQKHGISREEVLRRMGGQ